MSLTIEEQDRAIILSKKLAGEFDVERAANFPRRHKDKDWYEGFIALFNMITDIDFFYEYSCLDNDCGSLGVCRISGRCYSRFYSFYWLAG